MATYPQEWMPTQPSSGTPRPGATRPTDLPNMGGWGGTWANQPNIYGRNAGSFDVGRYFPNMSGFDEIYYQQNPDQAFRRAVNTEYRADTHANAWMQRGQQGVLEDWAAASLKNPNLLITDYLPGAMQQLAQRYTSLPSWQQGMNPASWFAGRRL